MLNVNRMEEQGRRDSEKEVGRDERGYGPLEREEEYQYWVHLQYRAERREEYQMDWRPRCKPKKEPIPDLLSSPLSGEIIGHPRLEGFKCPTLALYDRVGDLKDHVLNF